MSATLPPAGGPPAPRPAAPPPAMMPAADPPGRGLAYAVVGSSVLVGLSYVLLALAAVLMKDSMLAAYDARDSAGLDRSALVLAGFGLLTLVAWVLAFVLTGLWLLRLRRFSERVNPAFQHGRRRWWAFGGWVVPIVNLWFPLQYAGNVRDALRPDRNGGSLFGWWWAAFLVCTISLNATGSDDPDRAGLEGLATTALIQAGLVLVALVLWLLVVRVLATAVTEVPDDVLRQTAFYADPSPYDPAATAPGAPIYGPTGAGGPAGPVSGQVSGPGWPAPAAHPSQHPSQHPGQHPYPNQQGGQPTPPPPPGWGPAAG